MNTIDPETIRQMEKLYDKLRSYKKVARRVNVDKELVRSHFERKMAENGAAGKDPKLGAAAGKNKPPRPGQERPENKTISTPARAYKLYSELKRPLEVAIELGITAEEAMRYQEEYWKLNGTHYLNYLQLVQPDIWDYLELYGRMKMLKQSPEQFVGRLSDLAESEVVLKKMRQEMADIASSKERLEKELRNMQDAIKRQDNELATKKAEYSNLFKEMDKLEIKKQNMVDLLQRLVNSKTMSEMRDLVRE